MLKVYNVHSYYKVDDAPWIQCGHNGHAVRDSAESATQIYIENATWKNAFRTLLDKNYDGLSCGLTLFRGRPYIEVFRAQDDKTLRFYAGGFDRISYMDVYLEWTNCPLDWIVKYASAEHAIQYMVEHGMTTCPIMKN